MGAADTTGERAVARIRKVEIEHFRAIEKLAWCPTDGINCLVGPGDSGKSSILDAIDFCLGARRSLQFTDADFHRLEVQTPISISVTVGELDDQLKSFEAYGLYLRGFHAES
jgi:putative ATP-dependent endonuclease of the OLD family